MSQNTIIVHLNDIDKIVLLTTVKSPFVIYNYQRKTSVIILRNAMQ
jgi:hypothetical protein